MAAANSKTKAVKKVAATPAASSVELERELEVFKNAASRWGWRVRSAKNHKIVSTAGEDFTRKGDATKAATREAGFYRPGVAQVVIWED